MRAIILLPCLLFAACAIGGVPSLNAQSAPPAAVAADPNDAAAPPPESKPKRRAPHPAGARNANPARPPDDNPDAPNTAGDPVLQARADCWMAVEKQKAIRNNLDARIAFVDKCLAEHK